MDRDQNYWASLFGAYSNILEAPRSTLQNTSNIVQVVDRRSMLVTYRVGHMALGGYHALCCADKGSESGMSLGAGDKPHHTACALVVINSDDDSGILPQRTEHALHCQDRVMPSYRYFAVMAHIALEFLMKYDECAILTCYKLQKEFLLPLLVKSISSLANLRKLDKFTASHRVQAKLSFIDPANLNDYNDRLHETRWACIENRETRYTETCWHEQHILGGIILAANDDVPLRLELRSHKANKIVTQHASHYWRECRSERVALQVIQKDQAMMHIYHAMGVHRQHAQVRTVVVRMRNMKAVGMLCKAFHDFLSNVGLTVDKSRMALWPADGDSAEKTRNALEYLYQEGSRQHFERFLDFSS